MIRSKTIVYLVCINIFFLIMCSFVLSEDAFYDIDTSTLTIPSVIIGDKKYQVEMGLNGSCFQVTQISELIDTTEGAVTITHENGFDFSKGAAPEDWADSDGNVYMWVSDPAVYPDGYEWGSGIWYIPTNNDTDTINIKDMGEVSLASVTTVPDTWDGAKGQPLMPLIANHVYVVKCNDGYAKFLVKEIGPINEDAPWEAYISVIYQFTETTSF